MKKAMYFTLGLILLSLITNANRIDLGKKPLFKEQPTGNKSFDEKTRILNFGVGFGYSYYSYSSGPYVTVRHIPAISVSYEQPWSKRLGPGYLGIGGYLGFKASSAKTDYSDFYGSYTYRDVNNNFIIASRAMYHWDGLNFEKADIYGGFILGLRIETSHYVSEYTGIYSSTNGSNTNTRDLSLGVAAAFVAGARYYFTPKFGAYGELSYGISYLTLGVSLKI